MTGGDSLPRIKESLVSAVYNDVSVNNLATLIVPDSVADTLRQDKNLFHQTGNPNLISAAGLPTTPLMRR